MTNPPSSDLVRYRVSFFFGPEAADNQPDQVRCVFNVKKRSWKGGVQVAVDVARDCLVRARERIGYATWLKRLLQPVEEPHHAAVTHRADDLFVQTVCSSVLNLALHRGLEQENQTIDAEAFGAELDRVIDEQPEHLLEQIRLELDLEGVSHSYVKAEEPDSKPEGV